MTGLLFCLSAAAMGVDYGWQPVAGGGIEYIIQIDPALVDSLKEGSDVFSDLPSSVSNVRRYRITVGNERLPHHGEPPPAVVPASGEAPSNSRAPQRAKPAEIDMSQLPGPVLNPAMVLDGPADKKQSQEKEPERLADSDSAEPLGSRLSGFRQQRERSMSDSAQPHPNHGGKAQESGHRDDEPKTASTESKEKKEATKEQLAAREPESPSDQATAKPDESLLARSALTRIGLFTSVCVNVFLLWVATDQRYRYRSLVRRMFEGSGGALTNRDADIPRWERLPAPVKEGASDASGNEAEGARSEA
jgi:hypothetical protein